MSGSWRVGLALAVLMATAALGPRSAHAAYDFVVLASTPGPVAPVPSSIEGPSIDEAGAVAFLASAAGGRAVLVATEAGASSLDDYLLVEQRGDLEAVGSFRGGFVAYRYLEAGTYVFARGNGALPEILYSGSNVGAYAPAVNASGQLVLSGAGILLVEDQVATTLFSSGQELVNGNELDAVGTQPQPDIDDQGRVAFAASYLLEDACDDRILLAGSFGLSEIATGGVLVENCPFLALTGRALAMNATGSVAYTGLYQTPSVTPYAVFVDGDVVWDSEMPGFPDLSIPSSVALNDTGTTAFLLEAPSGRFLYAQNGPIAEKVVGEGDTICEGSVQFIGFQRYGLNDANQLAIVLSLSNGRILLVRAEPSDGPGGECITTPVPEPVGALGGLAALAVLALLRVRGRRALSTRRPPGHCAGTSTGGFQPPSSAASSGQYRRITT